MKKRFTKIFDINSLDEFKKAKLIQLAFSLTVLVMTLSSGSFEAIFKLTYWIKIIAIVILLRFYYSAHINRNFAYWGLSAVFLLYLVFNSLHYTFIEYNPATIYLFLISITLLSINAYIMSSPIFYPRVQWWEYDYRYRGDLKCSTNKNGSKIDLRITDLRRDAACIESFESYDLGKVLDIDIQFEDEKYILKCKVLTMYEGIPGRPYRYGVKVMFEGNDNSEYKKLTKRWNASKKVKLRSKFEGLN